MKLFAVSSRRGCLMGSLLLLAAALSSCAEVRSDKIVGTNVPSDLHVYEGRWRSDASTSPTGEKPETITFKIKDAAAGLLTLSPAATASDAPAKDSQCYFRTLGGKTFLSIPQEKGGYDFALLVSLGKSSAVVVLPNVPVFVRLVDSGVLRGKVEYNAEHKPSVVALEGLTEAECAKLFSGEHGDCFDWEHPLVFVRVTGP